MQTSIIPGKRHTPYIARHHRTLRTRRKRLVRKPMGLSPSTESMTW
jgi:hypothetical protein